MVIPEDICTHLQWQRGTLVGLSVEGDSLIIRKPREGEINTPTLKRETEAALADVFREVVAGAMDQEAFIKAVSGVKIEDDDKEVA